MTIVDLDTLARRHGTSCALSEPGRTLDYAALAATVQARATLLGSRGVDPGARVALRCAGDVETVVNALALLERGCTLIPLADDLTADEIEQAARGCGVRWIVRAAEVSVRPAPVDVAGRSATGAVLGLLSSGSTGTPKLVLRSAAQVGAGIEIYARSVDLEPGDRILALVPLAHAYGLGNVVLGALARGATVVFPATHHPRAVAEIVRAEGVTLLPAAPAFLDLMARFASGGAAPLDGLRACISIGGTLARRVLDAFTRAFAVAPWQSYGASEVGPVCLNRTGAADGDLVALGAPCDGVEVSLRDATGGEVAAGEVGEIVVRSPAVGLGYEGGHDGASRIVDGVFYSGDLGYRREGILYFAGRRKLLIDTGGEKVDPLEVEEVLRSHPRIADAAVLTDSGENGAAVLKAVLVTRGAVSILDVTDFCARRLSAHKIPRVIEYRRALPRDAMGKLRRDAL